MGKTIAYVISASAVFVSVALYFWQSRQLPPKPSPPMFNQLVSHPSGTNGYEDFVRAVDFANSSTAWQNYENGPDNPPIAVKRMTLADAKLQTCLTALRAGLNKQATFIHKNPGIETLYPEMKDFRSLARLLILDMDVKWTSHKNSDAVKVLEDGLAFGRAVEVGPMVSGIVGLYIQNHFLWAFAKNFNQMDVQDCQKVQKIVGEHLMAPDLQISLINSERDTYLHSFQHYRSNPMGLLKQLDPGPNAGAKEKTNFAEVCNMIVENPGVGPSIFDEAMKVLDKHNRLTIAELKRPTWKRVYPGPEERTSPAAKLIYSLCQPSYSIIGNRFAAEQALVQIIGVHAAVIQFKLQNGHLPDNIEQLKLGRMAVDPFTGRQLSYQRHKDENYEIKSEGPWDPGDSKRPPSGKRVPISVPVHF